MSTIVMTGATSGIGLVAATRLIGGGHRLIAGVRSSQALPGAELLPLDLADLASVRSFAERCQAPIDGLVLNAGMQVHTAARRSADGFELTFATNHLAHYLLARQLLPKLTAGGRIILTSSGTHDPAEKTGIPAPLHGDARRLADPDTDPDLSKSAMAAGLRAYSSSKLCNLMTARSLASNAEVTAKAITVHAYDPGFIPTTGLARNAPWIVRSVIMPVIGLLPLGKGTNTLDTGGNALAGLADGSIDATEVYMSLRGGQPTWPQPSVLARDDALCQQLWNDSATMVGLPD